MKFPKGILTHFLKYILCIIGVLAIGILLAILSKDRTLLLLTVAAAAAGAVKFIPLYKAAHSGDYETVEGMVISDTVIPFSSRHKVIIRLSDGCDRAIIIEGRERLCSGVMAYPESSKIPLIISVPGAEDYLLWFYPKLEFEAMSDALCSALAELPLPLLSATA